MSEQIPGKSKPFWIDSTPQTNFSKLKEGLKVDVVIIGGGIAGITTGLMLKRSGKKVAVIESDRIVKDVTATTTAKISAHTFYSLQLPNLGEDKTQIYAQANMNAVKTVAEMVSEYNIDCDFRRVPCYFYTESENEVDLFKMETELVKKLKLPANYTTDIPTSRNAKAGLIYENQAEFHPRKYLMALSEKIPGDGCYLFENTRFLSLKSLISEKTSDYSTSDHPININNPFENPIESQYGNQYEILTNQGSLIANNVVIASHFPVYDPDGLYNHLKITRSYIFAYYSNEKFPDAMFICVNPFHTYRSTPTEKGRLIIIAGEHQMVGEKNTRECYQHLENYVKENWNIKSIDYHWVNQDNGTPDGLPIIGETSQKGIYVATGFGGWGMTHGTTAGLLITDLINGRDTPLKEIFDPLRFENLEKEPVNKNQQILAQDFLNDKIFWPEELKIPVLAEDEAVILKDKFSAYKDQKGQIHKLQGICSHMGCVLVWNDAERTWDCPCHGARFDFEGKVIHGPAVRNLKNYSK